MAKQIIKSDGSREAFDAKKIVKSIKSAAKDAKLPPADINRISDQVSGIIIDFCSTRDRITTAEITEKILMELDRLASEVAATWREYDARRK